MSRASLFSLVFGFLVVVELFVMAQVQVTRQGLIEESVEMRPLPAAVFKLIALDYRDVVADLLFSRTLSFYGGKLNRRESVDAETYRAIHNRLDIASELDPHFVDPYFFGEAVLAWTAGMPAEANALLDRGRRARTDDWNIPFFMGFNAFYFLHDNVQAAAYLMESSRRPGSSPLVGLLAARLASKSGETETAIGFLEEMLVQTEDKSTREGLRQRIGALRGIAILEKAVKAYQAQFGRTPAALANLIGAGMLREIPADPYGGTFYITPEGRVWTTSDLRPVKS
ncbi:MAG TPA: hypothetical protein VMO00_05985 [Methylomirabilota bacterium]|nr:hypothetical protein [Methylomirabilota bacterium]